MKVPKGTGEKIQTIESKKLAQHQKLVETVEKGKAALVEKMEKCARFAKEHGSVGFVTVMVMGDGQICEFSDVSMVNEYHMVGGLESAKHRMLHKPGGQ